MGTPLQLTRATENVGKCVAIGRKSESTTDLIVVDCNVPAPSVCGLDTMHWWLVCLLSSIWVCWEGSSKVPEPCALSLSALAKLCLCLSLSGKPWRCYVNPDGSITLTIVGSALNICSGPLGSWTGNGDPTTTAPSPHWALEVQYGAPLDVSNTAKYLVNPRTARLFISLVTVSDEGYAVLVHTEQPTGKCQQWNGNPDCVGHSRRCVCVCVCVFVCVCVCVLFALSETLCFMLCRESSNPDYLAGPARDTSNIEVLQGTNLTVECTADTVHPSVHAVPLDLSQWDRSWSKWVFSVWVWISILKIFLWHCV